MLTHFRTVEMLQQRALCHPPREFRDCACREYPGVVSSEPGVDDEPAVVHEATAVDALEQVGVDVQRVAGH